MMKVVISEMEDMLMFEFKMICFKLKEVVEKGVVILIWNILLIKKVNEIKFFQFVDIYFEEDDFLDEEYQLDDEEEDEIVEESLLESDVESIVLFLCGVKKFRLRQFFEMIEIDEESGILLEVEKVIILVIRYISVEVVFMGFLFFLKLKQIRDSIFMEKLYVVDEELVFSLVCMDFFQFMDDSFIVF